MIWYGINSCTCLWPVWQLPEVLICSCVVSPQLYFVYWDMSRCLRTLTNTLEEHSCVANDIQVRDSSLCSPPPPPSSIFLTYPYERSLKNLQPDAVERLILTGLDHIKVSLRHFRRTSWGRKWLISSWWAKQRLTRGSLSRTRSRAQRSTGPCWGLRVSPAAAGQQSWRSSAPATASSPMPRFLLRWGGLPLQLTIKSGSDQNVKNCLSKAGTLNQCFQPY